MARTISTYFMHKHHNILILKTVKLKHTFKNEHLFKELGKISTG